MTLLSGSAGDLKVLGIKLCFLQRKTNKGEQSGVEESECEAMEMPPNFLRKTIAKTRVILRQTLLPDPLPSPLVS